VIAGTPLKLREKLTLATAGNPVSGTASEKILLSPDETAADSVLTLATHGGRVRLKAHKSVSFNLKLPRSIPTSVTAGSYHILIQFTDSTGTVSTIDSGKSLTVVAPVVDITGSFVKAPASVKTGHRFSATFLVTNSSTANVAATGVLPFEVETSADGQLSDAAPLLSKGRRINLKPGKSIRITVTGKISSSTFLVVTLDQGNKVFANDTNPGNNVFHTVNQILVV
jgi:hypothetical protein